MIGFMTFIFILLVISTPIFVGIALFGTQKKWKKVTAFVLSICSVFVYIAVANMFVQLLIADNKPTTEETTLGSVKDLKTIGFFYTWKTESLLECVINSKTSCEKEFSEMEIATEGMASRGMYYRTELKKK